MKQLRMSALCQKRISSLRGSIPRLQPGYDFLVISDIPHTRRVAAAIALPIVLIETSQQAQRGVHLVDLSAYIDKRRAAAVKECRQLTGTM